MRRDIAILFIGLFIVFTSCHFNAQYINDKSDKEAAEKITNKLYEQIKNKKFKEPNSLVSNAFLSVSGEDGLLNILVKKQKILGDFKSSRLSSGKHTGLKALIHQTFITLFMR